MASTHNRKYIPGRYSGLSYKAASMKGDEIVKEAAKLGGWTNYVDALVELRQVMMVAPRG